MNTFFVTGLPRSRTAWMAAYLTYGTTFCLHDGFVGLSHPKELKTKLKAICQPGIYWAGNSDPANLYFVDTLVELFPYAHWVLIKRDVVDCIASSKEAFGQSSEMTYELAQMEKLERYANEGKIVLQIVPFDKIDEMVKKGMFFNILRDNPIERVNLLSTMQIQLTEERLSQKHLCNPEIFQHADKNECILA